VTRRDELGELRRVAALARGYLREQVEGTRVEEHAYRARLAAALALVEPEDELRLTDPPTELRRCVAELVAQVAELEAVAELRELRDEQRDDERAAEELAELHAEEVELAARIERATRRAEDAELAEDRERDAAELAALDAADAADEEADR